MKNSKLVLCIIALSLGLTACGQVSKSLISQAPDNAPAQSAALKQTVVASALINLSLGQAQASGFQTQSVAQSFSQQDVQVVADVLKLLNFESVSSINFNVNQMAVIEADGGIALTVVYNDLAAVVLQGIELRASVVDQNGLKGQVVTSSLIPVDIKVNANAYTPIGVTPVVLKSWSAPFFEPLVEQVTLKLRGDFTKALKQQYTGSIKLELVRNEN